MNKTLEDTLNALCSEVTLLSVNDTQHIFQLNDQRQARSAFEILSSLDFGVKFYDEDHASRLYVERFSPDDAAVQQKLNLAFSYASAFKMLQDSLQTLCRGSGAPASDYSIKLMNLSDNKQQISITLERSLPTGRQIDDFILKDTPKPSVTANKQAQRPTRRGAKRDVDITVRGAPSLAKTHLMQNGPNKGKEKDAHWRWFYNIFFRHFTNNSADVFAFIFIVLVLMTISILLKGFVCPDFASDDADLRWYCSKEAFQHKFLGEKPPELF